MQLPGEEDADGAVDMEGEAKKLGVVQLVFEVYTRTWGVRSTARSSSCVA